MNESQQLEQLLRLIYGGEMVTNQELGKKENPCTSCNSGTKELMICRMYDGDEPEPVKTLIKKPVTELGKLLVSHSHVLAKHDIDEYYTKIEKVIAETNITGQKFKNEFYIEKYKNRDIETNSVLSGINIMTNIGVIDELKDNFNCLLTYIENFYRDLPQHLIELIGSTHFNDYFIISDLVNDEFILYGAQSYECISVNNQTTFLHDNMYYLGDWTGTDCDDPLYDVDDIIDDVLILS